MWLEQFKKFAATNKYIHPQPPATDREILEMCIALNLESIPLELLTLLRTFNGDQDTYLSAKEISETNLRLRAIDSHMPLDNILFFAGDGCGDYFGYGIRGDGDFVGIFRWEHEGDSRKRVAESLDDFFNGRFIYETI